MSELPGWIQVVIGALELMVTTIGVIVEIVDRKPKSPPEGGDNPNRED